MNSTNINDIDFLAKLQLHKYLTFSFKDVSWSSIVPIIQRWGKQTKQKQLNKTDDSWSAFGELTASRSTQGLTMTPENWGTGGNSPGDRELVHMCACVCDSSPPGWSALSFPPRRSRPPTGTESAVWGTGSYPGGWSALWSGSADSKQQSAQSERGQTVQRTFTLSQCQSNQEGKRTPEDAAG